MAESIFGVAATTDHLTALQMSVRAAVAYLVALLIVRVARRRFMGRNSAMDFIVAVTFGSTLSRGLTGNSPFWPVICACTVLVAVDLLLALVSCRFEHVGRLIKGNSVPLVRDGQVLRRAMLNNVISDDDLAQQMRLQGNASDLQATTLATLESNGSVSFVHKRRPPQVVEVRVQDGVQVVRVEWVGA